MEAALWVLVIVGALWLLAAIGKAQRQKGEEAKRLLADEKRHLADEKQRWKDDLQRRPLAEVTPSQTLLQPDEKAYAALLSTLRELKTVGFEAGSAGVSLRIAKGVTVRSSATRGRAIKGLVDVASGELVITNRRVIFAGDMKSVSMSLHSIVNITDYADGFALHDGRITRVFAQRDWRETVRAKVTLAKALAPRLAPILDELKPTIAHNSRLRLPGQNSRQ
jgi:hypothetical protein